MKKRICLLLMILALVFAFLPINVHAESAKFFTIECNAAEDANVAMNFSWHTDKGVTGSYLLYTKVDDTAWANATKVEGVATLNTAFAGKGAKRSNSDANPYEFMKNEATATNLEPGTKYMYKITDGSESSDVRYFKTGDQEFTFVWVSDFHAYSNGTRLANATQGVDQAIALANNNVDFVLSTGDIAAHGGTYEWWNQVSNATWMKKYMFMSTLGNHDWMVSAGTNYSHGASPAFFSACFNNPRNGFEGQENVCYYFYYGDALFINVNTESETYMHLGMDSSSEFVKAQQDWVESVLQNNTAQYIFLMQHYQALGTSGSYNSAGYTRWHEICDKYGIDVMFTGNSHVYMRTKPIYNGKESTDQTKGTVYMVAPSSDGDRGEAYKAPTNNLDLIEKAWSDSSSKAVSLVKVTQDGISIRLVDEKGTILDTVRILPHRGPSERVYKDLSTFDKATFEAGWTFQVNQKSVSTPKVIFPSDAYDVLRNYKVYDKATNEVLYEGPLSQGQTNNVLSNVKKGKFTVAIDLDYFDGTKKTLEFEVDNNYKWGTVSEEKIQKGSEKTYFQWKEEVTASKLSAIEVYLDGELYKKVSAGTGKVALPELAAGEEIVIKLVIKDLDGDVVYESEEILYSLVKKYTVKFFSDGVLLKEEKVEEGKSATAPADPVKEGYEFKGWDKDFSKVTGDLEVNAKFEEIVEVKVYTVRFYDGETLLKEEQVEEGKSATAPVAPTKAEHEFKGWDKDFSNITSDLDVFAKFEKIPQGEDPKPVDPEPQKKGCGAGAVQMVYSLITIFGLALVFRKREF